MKSHLYLQIALEIECFVNMHQAALLVIEFLSSRRGVITYSRQQHNKQSFPRCGRTMVAIVSNRIRDKAER